VENSDEIMTIKEAAKFLRVSEGYLYHVVQGLKECPGLKWTKIGAGKRARIRFFKRDLIELLENQKSEA